MEVGIKSTPSTSTEPDLDWSQVRETVRMLHLSVAQIVMAMQEGEDSVDALSKSFTSMVGNVSSIADAAQDIDADNDLGEIKDLVLENCSEVHAGMHQSIVAFQFYDRLSQRLSHVNQVLSELAGLVSDHSRLFNPGEWKQMQDSIRSRYTMAEEQLMFDALLCGSTIEEALSVVKEQLHQGEIDDIELF